MKYKPTIKDLAFVLMLIAFIIAVSNRNSVKRQLDDEKTKSELKDFSFDSLRNKHNQLVVEKGVLELNSKQEIKNLSAEVFDLKRKDEKRIKQVQALVRAGQKFRIDTVEIAYIDTIEVVPGLMVSADSVVLPPKHFKDSTKNYVIDGTVLLKSVRINKLDIKDTISLRIAEQKPKGIVRRITQPNNIVVQVVHSNDAIKTTGLQTVVLKERPNAWNRFIKPVFVAVVTGFISYKVLK